MNASTDVTGKIALCLSGGGLRATLFHLGVVKALRSHCRGGQPALASVCEIYSVSGGSITAAHLVRNWQRFVGPDRDYEAAEKELLSFCGLNIRDRVIRRWLLTRWAGKRRTDWLQKVYESLLGKGPISQCYSEGSAATPPDIFILATSFRTGELCSFSKDGFDIVKRSAGGPEVITAAGGHLPLAYAVAASSAFPPLFPPLALTPYMLGNPDEEEFAGTHYLSDGGVYDNFGIDKFRLNAATRPANPGILLISQAGGSFKSGLEERYSGTFSRNIRASDIMMRRLGENIEAAAASIEGVRPISVRIGDFVKGANLGVVTQRRLRLVRTDLDRFDPVLAGLLVDHGYRVGSKSLLAEGWAAPSEPKYLIGSEDPDRLDRLAGTSSKRRFLSLAMDFRDWPTTPLLWLIALLAMAVASTMVIKALNERAAEQRADEEREIRVREQAAQIEGQADLLERIRAAYASGNRESVEQVLGLAIRNTERKAENPDLVPVRASEQISAQQARAIVTEQPQLAIPGTAGSHNQKVFIQFAGSLTRARITALNQALRSAGWRAQGASGERLPQAGRLNEIRYSGDNAEAARALAEAINAASVTSRPVRAVQFPGIPADVLEAWISN